MAVLDGSPHKALAGEPWHISATGLEPGTQVRLVAEHADIGGLPWKAEAVLAGDGTVDTAVQRSDKGTYEGLDQAGLFWSARPDSKEKPAGTFTPGLAPDRITISLEVDGESVASQEVERLRVLPGVERVPIREEGVVGTLFLPEQEGPRPAMVVFGGSEGGVFEPSAAIHASHGYVTLALAYFRLEGLPDDLVEIPLETVERGLAWLAKHPRVRADAIGVWGASKGAELALLSASRFPQLRAVVAKSPSAVAWEGISDERGDHRSSWTEGGQPVPFLPWVAFTSRIGANFAWTKLRHEPFATRPMYEHGLADREAAERAAIAVERIDGPVLLVSGGRDEVWPASEMADMIMDRLKAHDHPFDDVHLHYEGAGHQIVTPYSPTTVNWLTIPGGMIENLGSSPEANAQASADSWAKINAFLTQRLGE